MDLPDLQTLHCFIVLSKHLSFKKAAQQTFLSPAAFSDRIKRLEENLGFPLFERSTRKVKLTSQGLNLLPYAHHLLKEAWHWNEVVQNFESPSPYHFKLGTRFELGLSWLVPSLSKLKGNQPHRSIELKWGNDKELIELLKRGELDALISSVRVNTEHLKTCPLHKEEYVFVASPHLNPFPLHLQDMYTLTLIDTEATLPLFRYFSDVLSAHYLESSIDQVSSNRSDIHIDEDQWQHFEKIELMGTIAAVRARVLEHVGVAVLPLYFVQDDLVQGRLVQLWPEFTLHHDFFRLIWHEDQPRVNLLKALAQELRELPLS